MREWSGASRRRVPRFQMQSPLDVTALRSGVPDTMPGRAVNVCERGIAVMLAGELLPGETVRVEVQLSGSSEPLRTMATVRYHDKLRCGLEFMAISPEQRSALRNWAKDARPETEIAPTILSLNRVEIKQIQRRQAGDPPGGGPKKKRLPVAWIVVFLLAVIAAATSWWRWNRAWEKLESGLRSSRNISDEPRVRVPTEVMQRLLVHRVEPVYPADARKDNLQGIIALDIVVAKDGSVISMHALNGPDVLAQAAMDALRWWKFEPYRVNGQPVTVETTVAVEFKP